MVLCQKEFSSLYWRHTYPQYWNRIIEKHGLKPVNSYEFTDLPPHRFIGMLGDSISKNITTGPCLLTPKEIRSLNSKTTIEEVQKMLMRHPTFEDYVSIAVETRKEYETNIIVETYEYAKLIEYKTNISFDEALELTKKAADNFKRYYDRKLKNNKVKYHLTHESSFDRRLRELCNEHYRFYLDNNNMSKKAREIIENNPEESTWLRIKVSFLPEAINKDESTIIEPASSIEGMKNAMMLSNVSAVVTRSPQTLTNKPVMNEGYEHEIFYLNNDINGEIKKFNIPKNKKSPFSCPIYNLFAFISFENTEKLENYFKEENCEGCLEYAMKKLSSY
ncbi:MAG: hypothetical protein PWP15_898 [Methanothermococcus sp.]|uniref:hypothetical protein n=1 Tax=Methanothermococcus TaxID=155862 RepID=UPI0003657A41|nr:MULTISPECIES: hypothetical protein [Methanothermococcus]MDK2790391.1 hypothetical protein [Methanothermococcus sp.]MDK2987498.1 hypothetical protein [Methanothermococcus sp.]